MNARKKSTVLVVDDDDDVRRLVAYIFQARGYRVFEAGSGRQGLACFLRHHGNIDLIVSDLVMPDLPGPEMALRILRWRPQVPIVFISGYTHEELPARLRRYPLLRKPFAHDQLLRTAEASLGLLQ